MKRVSSAQKTVRAAAYTSCPDTSTGPNGMAIAPPAYGIESVDRRSREVLFKLGQQYPAPAQDVAIQRKAAASAAGSDAGARSANNTGLPDHLKAGIERLSGLAMDEVRVHYNSAKPAQLQALAYTQGTEIHVGPGQERHLPHEAWHVVQQKQGRVKPTTQMKGAAINDDQALEREAEILGMKARQMRHPGLLATELTPQVPIVAYWNRESAEATRMTNTAAGSSGEKVRPNSLSVAGVNSPPVAQRKYYFEGFDYSPEKLSDMMVALEGSNNKYLNFFKTDWGDASIKLDPSNDKNPGDANLLYRKSKDSNWSYGNIENLRKLTMIYGIGAEINVRQWFFDKYPSGKVLSMVAHEVGVHIVPYMDELMAKLPVEAGVKPDPKYIDVTKQHGPSGRIDHRRVADITHVDFELYKGVVTDMIGAMIEFGENRGGPKKPLSLATASSLADAYLMDLSTLSEGGKRLTAPVTAGSIANKYNSYRQATKLEKQIPPKTSSEVLQDYGRLYKIAYPVVWKQHPVAMTTAHLLFILIMYLLYWLTNYLLF